MQAFEYAHPRSVTEALPLLGSRWGETEILAGGTDLLSLMKNYVVTPKRVVNIKGLRELSGIRATPAGIHIGALMTLEELRTSQPMHEYPALAQAAAGVTSPQIRNMGTVGGDLCQRPRCWYFRNEEFVCFKKGGSRCFAENGENQYHAIFGNEGPSHIVHPSSLAVPFVAYGARFRVVGPAGEREVPAADYFTMPTLQNVLKENVLEDEEILTHVILPAPGAIKTGHYEVRYKQSHDWPLAFTTVVLTMNGNTISSARVVLGAVAPVPWRSKPAEAALAGKPLNAQTAAMAAEAAVSEAKPMSGNAYKVQIAKTAVKRAIMQAAGIRTA